MLHVITDNEYCKDTKQRRLSHLIDNTWLELCIDCAQFWSCFAIKCESRRFCFVYYYRVMPGGLEPDHSPTPSSFFPVFAVGAYVFQGGSNSPPPFFPGPYVYILYMMFHLNIVDDNDDV